MNKEKKTFNECVDILENVYNAVSLTITLGVDEGKSPIDIVQESLNSYKAFLLLSDEDRAILEKETDIALEKLAAINPDVKIVDDRPKKNKKVKKELLN